MALLDITTGANFIPELWADPIYKFYQRANKLSNSVDDYSSLVKGQGDTVHIPKIALKAAVARTFPDPFGANIISLLVTDASSLKSEF